MRTTIDLDPGVLRELKRRAHAEGKTLGGLASEMLSTALEQEPNRQPVQPLAWTSRPMGVLVDLEDPEAVRRALESS